jgi:peptide chain release factor subunit 1
VETLFLEEGVVAPGVVCDASRWMALSGESCPVCGEPPRAAVDVVEELVEAVIEEGGSIHHVPPDAGLGERLAAASLRFPLPPAPEAADGRHL